MSIDPRWIAAAVLIFAGVLVGTAGGVAVRRILGRDDRPPALREIAGPASTFVFWFAIAGGLVFSLAMASPETLEPIPASVIAYLPRVLVGALILLVGRILAVTAATAIGKALSHAAGGRQRLVERVVRTIVMTGTGILALSQLGVDTTILTILVAGLVFGTALSVALLSGTGGRQVAQNVAAGRSLQRALVPGQVLTAQGISGRIERLHAVTVEVRTRLGTTHIPYAQLLDGPLHLSPDDEGGGSGGDETGPPQASSGTATT